MKLINNSLGFLDIEGKIIKTSAIQLMTIDRDAESLGGKEYLYISTGLFSFKIYGKKKIREFLATNFSKGTINGITLK